MATNSVENILAGAKKSLSNASKFTQSVEGNPTSSFATHEFSKAPYSIPHKQRTALGELDQEAKSVGEGLKARAQQSKELEQ